MSKGIWLTLLRALCAVLSGCGTTQIFQGHLYWIPVVAIAFPIVIYTLWKEYPRD